MQIFNSFCEFFVLTHWLNHSFSVSRIFCMFAVFDDKQKSALSTNRTFLFTNFFDKFSPEFTKNHDTDKLWIYMPKMFDFFILPLSPSDFLYYIEKFEVTFICAVRLRLDRIFFFLKKWQEILLFLESFWKFRILFSKFLKILNIFCKFFLESFFLISKNILFF